MLDESTPSCGSPKSLDERRVGVATKRVLVADDDPLALRSLEHCLEKAGFFVEIAVDGEQASRKMTKETLVALVDLNMPGRSGLECVNDFRERFPDSQVIVISAATEVRDAVEAMKSGAYDYLTKPFEADELLTVTNKAIESALLSRANRELTAAVDQPQLAQSFSTNSPIAIELSTSIERIAATDSNVLIVGESGTGKSTIARMIHQRGPRAAGPFIAVNCAALPRDLIESELFGHAKGAFTGATNDRPGRIEIANGGTLFLDEIGDLPIELQPKLLTFLQDHSFQRIGCNDLRSVDVRVISATHQELMSMCVEKRFREDLYYRLNVLELVAPPLRERRGDIVSLAGHILERISLRRSAAPYQIEREALELLETHHWPGNIRELENVLERATVFCERDRISSADIKLNAPQHRHEKDTSTPPHSEHSLAGKTLAEIEAQAIGDTLKACHGNKAMSARQLGISEKSIYNKMKRLRMTNDTDSGWSGQ